MARGGKFISNRSKKRKVRSIEKGSDDSDEDYVLGEDEQFNESEESYGPAEDASEDSFDIKAVNVSSDEEEEVRRVDRKKASKPKKASFDREETRIRRRVERNNRVSDDEEEDYDFDDEDDEEFTLDGNDCADEEEDLQVKKKNNQARKKISHKRVSVKSKKRKRKSKASKKPLKKKRRKLVVRRTVSSDDDDFVVDYKAVPKKSKNKGRSRIKKMAVDWDSDYACSGPSGPSDVEYTVSDEQIELLREASKFCGTISTCSRDSSLSKRLQCGGDLNCQQSKPTGPKGKEKVLNLQNDLGKQICGICFSEEGKGTVQGTLNCCNHFFCFACIMEWSKVESRCPLCKQRFVTISKPARTHIGIDLRNMVIQVPKRDQVYQPSEEELRGYLDPYENVVCMECQLGGDDNLMLLCDICDSPAHTYCVGLGREVPEGNWYCKGCRTSDPGSSNSPVQESLINQGTSSNTIPTDMSTHRISAEDHNLTPRYSVSVTDPSTHGIEILSSPRYPVREDVHAASPTGAGASTLSGRRRIHRQIRSLLSNNRTGQITEMVGRLDGISYDTVRSEADNIEVKQVEETTAQHAENFVNRGFQSAAIGNWVQDADSCSLEDRIPISVVLGHSRRQVNQAPSTTITNGSTGLSDELDMTNSIMGFECLYQFSRPFNRPDDSMPPSGHFHGEGTEERCSPWWSILNPRPGIP